VRRVNAYNAETNRKDWKCYAKKNVYQDVWSGGFGVVRDRRRLRCGA
jgi:hypothetical protein